MKGSEAEDLVAGFLTSHDYKILARNWRTKRCEIDIVAVKEDVAHIVEVKYRKNDRYGAGYEYITRPKARHLRQAALMWVSENGWDRDYRIDVVSVSKDGEIDYIEGAIESV